MINHAVIICFILNLHIGRDAFFQKHTMKNARCLPITMSRPVSGSETAHSECLPWECRQVVKLTSTNRDHSTAGTSTWGGDSQADQHAGQVPHQCKPGHWHHQHHNDHKNPNNCHHQNHHIHPHHEQHPHNQGAQVTVIPRAVLDWGASPHLKAEWDQLVGMDILAKPNPTYYI